MNKKQLIVTWLVIFCLFVTPAFAKNRHIHTKRQHHTGRGQFTKLSANFSRPSFSIRSNTGQFSRPSFSIKSNNGEFSKNSFSIRSNRREFSKPSFSMPSNKGEFSVPSFTIASNSGRRK